MEAGGRDGERAGELDSGWSSAPLRPAGAAAGAAAALASGEAGSELATLAPRGVGAILDAALEVLRARFAACVGLSLAVWLPVATLERVLASLDGFEVSAFVVQMLLQFVAQFLVVAMVVHLVYAHLQGRRVSALESAGQAARRGLSILALGLVTQIAVTTGTFCCLVPGLLVGWMTAVAPAALVLERLGPIDALVRASRLARGSFGRWLALVLFQFALVLPVTSVVGVLSEPELREGLLAASGLGAPAFTVLEVGLTSLLMALATSLAAVVMTVLYIDFRVRTEGFDLSLRLERLAAVHPSGARA